MKYSAGNPGQHTNKRPFGDFCLADEPHLSRTVQYQDINPGNVIRNHQYRSGLSVTFYPNGYSKTPANHESPPVQHEFAERSLANPDRLPKPVDTQKRWNGPKGQQQEQKQNPEGKSENGVAIGPHVRGFTCLRILQKSKTSIENNCSTELFWALV
jgi:hypothetical protein